MSGRPAGPTIEDEHFHDECGVFGLFGHAEASNITYLGLHGLQHRGQESAGIASADGQRIHTHRVMGLVQDNFSASTLASLPGDRAIGHVRYSTAGGSEIGCAQPITVRSARGWLSLAHNGNLPDAEDIRARLEEEGSIFQTTTDSEVIVHLIARSSGESLTDRIVDALSRVEGAYSLLFLSVDQLVAVRDPWGFRPLCLGRLGDAWVVASESTSFDLIEATFERDVAPGEMVVIDARGMRSFFPFPPQPRRLCIFEHIYFARPDSVIDGQPVIDVRRRLGERLADEQPAEADVVVAVPDSGTPAALGYANRLRIPFALGLIRSHYVGRTFIEPRRSIRRTSASAPLNPVRAVLSGRRVAVVDGSIVRGTTSMKIVRMLREAAPPPCTCASPRPHALALLLRHRLRRPARLIASGNRPTTSAPSSAATPWATSPSKARTPPPRALPRQAVLRRLLLRRLPRRHPPQLAQPTARLRLRPDRRGRPRTRHGGPTMNLSDARTALADLARRIENLGRHL